MGRMEDLLAGGDGIVLAADHPSLRPSLARWAAAGKLCRVLPGVYIAAGSGPDTAAMAHAVQRRHSDAVFTRGTAAQHTFWPDLRSTFVSVGNLRLQGGVVAGIRASRRTIPPELVCRVRGLRLTVPDLTALDLAVATDGESIDRLLRSRMGTLAGMSAVLGLTEYRRGNRERRLFLLDSRDEPWSKAERVAHKLLRAAGITGWQANHRIRCGGRTYFLDIAFPGLKVVIEIDGREHHGSQTAFEGDRERQNDLVAAGWSVLRFTWTMLTDSPEVVITRVKEVLRLARMKQISRSTRRSGSSKQIVGSSG